MPMINIVNIIRERMYYIYDDNVCFFCLSSKRIILFFHIKGVVKMFQFSRSEFFLIKKVNLVSTFNGSKFKIQGNLRKRQEK